MPGCLTIIAFYVDGKLRFPLTSLTEEREVRRKEKERRYVKVVGQAQQGAWTQWEGVQVRTLTWQEIWRMVPILLKNPKRGSD